MMFQYNHYIWPLAASACISLSLGIYALLKRRNAKGAVSFILSMFVVTIWSSGNALEMSGADFATKLFWANIQYFAYCYSPVTLLALCMEFTGYDRLIRSRNFLWIAVIPTIVILLVWTDGIHGLMRYDMHMDYSGYFPVISKKYGPVFYIHAFYSQLLNISAWVLLVKAVFSKSTIYRRQAVLLLLGASLIIMPNIIYISGLSPIKRFDITPLFFGPAGLITAWGIFRYKLFDVIPQAWATVIKTMDAGVMVLDLKNRVLDINPAFERIIGQTASAAAAKPLKEICVRIPELADAITDKSTDHREVTITADGAERIYEIVLSALNNDKGLMIGRLAVFYDITRKKQEQQAYMRQQWEQAVRIEKERHARDMHDNLGQVLGFINLQAQGIRQELMNAGIELVSQKLDRLVNAAQVANNDIREYIRNARNADAMEKDFISALKQMVSSFEEQTGVRTKLDISFQFSWEEMNPNIRINLLNIVKEALNNIRKHAEARNVTVSFSVVQEKLYILVEDDGKGFDVELHNRGGNTRFGLSIMRERASEIGACLELKSSIDKGSRIALYLPMREEIKNADESNAG